MPMLKAPKDVRGFQLDGCQTNTLIQCSSFHSNHLNVCCEDNYSQVGKFIFFITQV